MALPFPTQAILTAGGESSRFHPFSTPHHKSLFPLYTKSLLEHTLDALAQTSIKKVIIITKESDFSAIEAIKVRKHNLEITVVLQSEPLGMADALVAASPHLESSFVVLHPYQVAADALIHQIESSVLEVSDLVVFTTETNTPQEYGMVALAGNRITAIKEKPQNLEGLSSQRIVGMYVLSREFVESLKHYELHHYLLEDALGRFAENHQVTAHMLPEAPPSLKHPWDLFHLSSLFLARQTPYIHESAKIHETAIIEGNVVIDEGAEIYHHAIISGPAYIGKHCVIGSFCKVRKGSILEAGAEIENQCEVKNSLIGSGTHIHSGFVGDSIIGSNVRIGALFATANRRFDRGEIKVKTGDKTYSVGSSYFGTLIGDEAKIGILCGTNPGAVIEKGQLVFPGTIV